MAAHRKLRGYNVHVVNASHWMSEIGANLSPNCDFAMIWYYDHNSKDIRVSLRAFHDVADVSEVAKIYGGGGHRKAAGFNLPGDCNIEEIFDDAFGDHNEDLGEDITLETEEQVETEEQPEVEEKKEIEEND